MNCPTCGSPLGKSHLVDEMRLIPESTMQTINRMVAAGSKVGVVRSESLSVAEPAPVKEVTSE